MTMQTQQYLDQLASNSDRLADVAAAVGVDAAVPTCTGWTVTDLLDHMIRGDLWARTIVEQGKRGITDRVLPEAPADQPEGDALVPYFRAGATALVDALASTDPSTPVWTFGAHDRTAAFWQRRRAQETAVHRFDAEAAAGTPTPIDTELAVDGIDEFLVVFLPRLADNFGAVGDGTVHVHCTDADGEWLVALCGGQPTVTREHAKGDVAARGSASDLLLFLWGRVPADSLEVFGDADLLASFRAAIRV
jgi:uncharacterized protein (TIGR03083 family)